MLVELRFLTRAVSGIDTGILSYRVQAQDFGRIGSYFAA